MQNKLYQRHISPSIALIGLFVSITFVTLLAPHVELAYNIYPVYLLVISTAILLCLFWLIHAYFNRDNRCSKTKGVLIWCGTNSLAIFGIHQLITDTFEILENKLSFESYCWTFLEFLICVAICYAATSFINKRIPWALGKI